MFTCWGYIFQTIKNWDTWKGNVKENGHQKLQSGPTDKRKGENNTGDGKMP